MAIKLKKDHYYLLGGIGLLFLMSKKKSVPAPDPEGTLPAGSSSEPSQEASATTRDAAEVPVPRRPKKGSGEGREQPPAPKDKIERDAIKAGHKAMQSADAEKKNSQFELADGHYVVAAANYTEAYMANKNEIIRYWIGLANDRRAMLAWANGDKVAATHAKSAIDQYSKFLSASPESLASSRLVDPDAIKDMRSAAMDRIKDLQKISTWSGTGVSGVWDW